MRSSCSRSRIKNKLHSNYKGGKKEEEDGPKIHISPWLGSSGIAVVAFQDERSADEGSAAARYAALVRSLASTRSLKAGFDAQRACIRIVAAFLNQLATTKRTSRPSISRPLGYRVPVAADRCYYRRGARVYSIVVQLSNAFCRQTETRRRVFPSY